MSMREKIAMRLFEQNGLKHADLSTLDQSWRDSPQYHDLFLRQADAVLDALMEPTEGMKEKGAYGPTTLSYGDEDSFYYVSEDDAGEIFSSMIEAAKEEK